MKRGILKRAIGVFAAVAVMFSSGVAELPLGDIFSITASAETGTFADLQAAIV